jgi:iron uptake system component EfeO
MKRWGMAVGALAVVAAGCSAAAKDTQAVTITSTATTCVVAPVSVLAGPRTFTLVNKGTQFTEAYIYAPGDKVVAMHQNVGPGTTAKFTASLPAGHYDIACKPGQKNDRGIRRAFTVRAKPKKK